MTLFNFITELENPQRAATPTASTVLRSAATAFGKELRVCLPGIVLRYDHSKQQADIQPSFKRRYGDGHVTDMPPIYNVPVVHPRSGNAYIHLPLKKGQNVLLLFADRSLEKWLSSGGQVDPDDPRMHHLSDAIAMPGLYAFNEAVAVANGDDIIVKNGAVELRVKPNNHFQLLNQQHEFVAVLDEILTTLREAVVYTSTGPQPLRHAALAMVHAKLKTFREG